MDSIIIIRLLTNINKHQPTTYKAFLVASCPTKRNVKTTVQHVKDPKKKDIYIYITYGNYYG